MTTQKQTIEHDRITNEVLSQLKGLPAIWRDYDTACGNDSAKRDRIESELEHVAEQIVAMCEAEGINIPENTNQEFCRRERDISELRRESEASSLA